MKFNIFQHRVSNSKVEKKKFNIRVSNSKVEKKKFNIRVSNSKWNLMFYEVEIVTQKKNFCKTFWVGNSKCDVILRYSIS